jgi:hypothetical protein
LFSVFVDHANFAGTDTFVGSDKRLRCAFIYWRNRWPPQWALVLAVLWVRGWRVR